MPEKTETGSLEQVKLDNKREDLEEIAKLGAKFLKDNYHSHAKIIINIGTAEVVSGEMMVRTKQNEMIHKTRRGNA